MLLGLQLLEEIKLEGCELDVSQVAYCRASKWLWFSVRGILDILNTMYPDKHVAAPGAQPTVGCGQESLDAQAYKLTLEEIQYDEQCLHVYLRNVSNHHARVMQQRESWLKKRMDLASSAANQWWDTKARKQLQR